jgi:hypothetical protein
MLLLSGAEFVRIWNASDLSTLDRQEFDFKLLGVAFASDSSIKIDPSNAPSKNSCHDFPWDPKPCHPPCSRSLCVHGMSTDER